MRRSSFSVIACLIAAAAAACSRGDADQAKSKETAPEAPRPTVISAPVGEYKVISVSDPGSITGTVDFDGPTPAAPVSNDPACGKPPAETVSRTGSRVGGVVVWLTDIRSGKGFPPVRRFELMNDHCILDPHVQVVLTTGTLQVGSEDRVQHLDRFIDVSSGRTVALAPFNDEGEVVPLDHSFLKPAEIEVVCDMHPASHAWLAVLDHPYFATTTAAGAFTIDGVPAGKYHLRAWHPTLGIVDETVTVVAGKPVNLALRLTPKNFDAERSRPPRLAPGGGFSAPKPSLSDSLADSVRGDSGSGAPPAMTPSIR
jgi:hypothetical protein